MDRERQGVAANHGGSDLASRYEVIGRLAVGGMAELFLARPRDPALAGHVVVVKRILPQLAEDPEFVRMFRDEANLAATLHHPNIVAVYDVGLEGNEPFFTMEYVHGENLRTIVRNAQSRNEPIPLQHVLTMAVGLTAALHYAHEQVDRSGRPLMIVHRDVSPTNVLVGQDGVVKIVDFGIAKAAAATHVTQAGMLKGKASYMSPEQCRAEAVDRRSDIFAIGILLYELTTLQRLFRGDNELAILHQILTGTMTPPSQVVAGYPPELEQILLRTLSTSPAGRPATALALQQELEAFAVRHGHAISNVALAGYLRERFGVRPYPWTDVPVKRPEEAPSEVVAAAPPPATARAGAPARASTQASAKPASGVRPAPQLRTATPGVLARRATASSSVSQPTPTSIPAAAPVAELPDEATMPRDVGPGSEAPASDPPPRSGGTFAPPPVPSRSTPSVTATAILPRDASRSGAAATAPAPARPTVAPPPLPGTAASRPGATLVPTSPSLPGPTRSGPTAAGPPVPGASPPRPPLVAPPSTEPARSGATAMGAPSPPRSGATFTPPGPPHSAPTLQPPPGSSGTQMPAPGSAPSSATCGAAPPPGRTVAPGSAPAMSAEQAAFLRGERPAEVAFTAGAPDTTPSGTQVAVRTQIAPPGGATTPPGATMAPTSVAAAPARTVIAPPPEPSRAPAAATVIAPPASLAERTVIAPPAAGPRAEPRAEQTVIAPPRTAAEQTVIAPPRTAAEQTVIAPHRTAAEHTVIAPPRAAAEHTVIAPPAGAVSTELTVVAPAATSQTVIAPARPAAPGPGASHSGSGTVDRTVMHSVDGEPVPPRPVVDRTVMLPQLDTLGVGPELGDDERTLIAPPRTGTRSTAPPSTERTAMVAMDLGPAPMLATQPMPRTELPASSSAIAPAPRRRSILAPILIVLGAIALFAGGFAIVWPMVAKPDAPKTEGDGATVEPTPSDGKAADDGSKPADDGSKPADDGSKPADDGSKPADDGSKPADDGSKVADDGSTPADDGSTPVAGDDGKPNTDDGGKPNTDDGGKPNTDDGGKPNTDDGGKPADDGGKKPPTGTSKKKKKKKTTDGGKKPPGPVPHFPTGPYVPP